MHHSPQMSAWPSALPVATIGKRTGTFAGKIGNFALPKDAIAVARATADETSFAQRAMRRENFGSACWHKK